jgi:hypothetical protein
MSGSLPLEQLENTLERAIENVRQVCSVVKFWQKLLKKPLILSGFFLRLFLNESRPLWDDKES